MNMLRFVHLSDIHFGQNRNGSVVFHADVRAELLNHCRVMRNKLGNAQGVLITGDIAYAGKREQYEESSTWLAQLTNAVGCKRTDVRVIPGNHDIDFDEIGYATKIAHHDLRNRPPNEIQGILDEIASGHEEGNPLLPKLKAYRVFAAEYDCDFESVGRPIWTQTVVLSDCYRLRFVGLNSVQVSDRNDKDREGTMVLGKRQYILTREENVEYVVLLHHPLNYFKDREEAKNFLNSRAKVLMTGHEHVPCIEKIAGESDDERLVISAGATNPPEVDYRYTYSWMEFSHREVGNIQNLVVRVHPSVWVKEQTSFAPDRSRLNGEDSKEFILKCPMFRKQGGITQPAEAETHKEAAAGSENSDNNMNMVSREDERFARLRYFFWRFLDWRQRLSVLADLDIRSIWAQRRIWWSRACSPFNLPFPYIRRNHTRKIGR
jgi:predicted phosphodiesterase